MKNYLLPIYHSKLKPWIKWWLLKQLELRSKTLSDWIEGTTPITIKGAFKGKIQNLELEGNTSQTGTPTPEAPIPVQVVKQNNVIKVNTTEYPLDLVSKNLCDIILDSSVSGDISYKTYTLKPNTQYTISTNTWITITSTANIFASSGTSFTPSSATNGVNDSRIITSDSNGKITLGYRNVNNSLDYASGEYWVMLNEGSTALPYEPYYDYELCKIGDEYSDYILKDNNGYKILKNVGKVVLNGTQNITLAGSGVRRFNVTYSTLGISNVKEGINATDTAQYRKNDHFVYSGTVTTWGNYYMYSNWLVLFDTGSIIADASALNTWFTSNPTNIYYALATTTTETITNTNLISQLDAIYNAEFKNGTNTITQTPSDLPFILHFKYYKKG